MVNPFGGRVTQVATNKDYGAQFGIESASGQLIEVVFIVVASLGMIFQIVVIVCFHIVKVKFKMDGCYLHLENSTNLG